MLLRWGGWIRLGFPPVSLIFLLMSLISNVTIPFVLPTLLTGRRSTRVAAWKLLTGRLLIHCYRLSIPWTSRNRRLMSLTWQVGLVSLLISTPWSFGVTRIRIRRCRNVCLRNRAELSCTRRACLNRLLFSFPMLILRCSRRGVIIRIRCRCRIRFIVLLITCLPLGLDLLACRVFLSSSPVVTLR